MCLNLPPTQSLNIEVYIHIRMLLLQCKILTVSLPGFQPAGQTIGQIIHKSQQSKELFDKVNLKEAVFCKP